MKCIIFGGYYKEIMDANAMIVLKIARELIKNNECDLIFLDETINEITNDSINNIQLIRIPIDKKYRNIRKDYISNNNSKLNYAIHNPIKFFKHFLYRTGYFLKYQELNMFINKKINSECFDYVVLFSIPFMPVFSVYKKININVKKIYYQLDPWGLNEYLPKISKIFRITNELFVIRKSYRVFTTFLLYKQYLGNDKYSRYINKMIPLNFPNLSNNIVNKITKKNNDIQIYFFGTIDDKYRNPKMIVDFMLSSSLNLSIHFIGFIKSRELIKIQKNHPDKVFIHNPISHDEVIELMKSNIFLLNINNSFNNQEPSKLIEYISTGNPIINCIKLNNDSSIEILKKYPLVYSFYENAENNIIEFNKFITTSMNTSIDNSLISCLYNEYSPQSVTDKLIKSL